MIKIEKYHDWLNENELSEAVSKHIEHPFIELASDVLEEHGFEFLLESSRVQLRNGTLLLKHISNYKLLSDKLQEFGVEEIMRKSGMTAREIEDLYKGTLGEFIIYSAGSARRPGASSDAVRFHPDKAGLEKTFIPWFKRYLFDTVALTLTSEPKFIPQKVKVEKTMKGYTLSHATFSFIQNELKDSMRMFPIETLEQKLSKFPKALSDSFSPFLTFSALLKMSGMYIRSEFRYFSPLRSNYFSIYWNEDGKTHDVSLKWITVKSAGRNLDRLDYTAEVSFLVDSYDIHHDRMIDYLPAISSELFKAAKSPLTEQEMKDQIHRKRGTLKGSEFGF